MVAKKKACWTTIGTKNSSTIFFSITRLKNKNKNNNKKMKKHEIEPTELLSTSKVIQWWKLLQQQKKKTNLHKTKRTWWLYFLPIQTSTKKGRKVDELIFPNKFYLLDLSVEKDGKWSTYFSRSSFSSSSSWSISWSFMSLVASSLPSNGNGKRFEIDNEEHQTSTTQYKKLTFEEKNFKKVWKMYITWPMMFMRCAFFSCSPIVESFSLCFSLIIDNDTSFLLYFGLVLLCSHLLQSSHSLVLSILELCI